MINSNILAPALATGVALVLTSCGVSQTSVPTPVEVMLVAELDKNEIELELVNRSLDAWDVNKLFRFFGMTPEIDFAILDKAGKEMKMLPIGYIREIAPLRRDAIVRLGSRQTVGHIFPIADLKELYGLKKGCYDLNATYLDVMFSSGAGKLANPLVSNSVSFCTD